MQLTDMNKPRNAMNKSKNSMNKQRNSMEKQGNNAVKQGNIDNNMRYKKYGIAFDLGTTTLVGYLCDLENKEVIETISCVNPQVKFGKDVVSRVTYMSEGKAYKDEVGNTLAVAIIEISEKLVNITKNARNVATSTDMIWKMPLLLVGNPVIMGSVANVNFESLWKKNQKNVKENCLDIKCEENEYSSIEIETIRIPGIGNYVGADALSVMTMVEHERKSGENVIMIDIGTNTEMAIMTDEGNIATSAAAGPAFEGGNIECGMSAQEGAIDYALLTNEVNVNSDIILHTIGGVTAVGICGSGLLSVISILLKVGVVDENGYMLSKEEALANNVPGRIASRIETITSDIIQNEHTRYGRLFKLTETVFVSQEDIRNVQLAKSAIRSGIEILILKKKLTESVIDKIYLAGAFGNKIEIEDIITIGMVPGLEKDKIVQSGNLAGVGAYQMLLNNEEITCAIDIKNNTLTVSLDREESFQNEFVKYMSFTCR